MQKPQNCILTIFGASGDLTKRKLMPALFDLFLRNFMPEKFSVLGTGRTKFSDDSFRESMLEALNKYYSKQKVDKSMVAQFLKNIYYLPTDSKNEKDFEKLKSRLDELDHQVQSNNNYIYYLATSPSLFETISKNLGNVGLQLQGDGTSWKRIVLEKPFGYDLKSATSLNTNLLKNFTEDQIYRIDHYLGKETVQNILALRFSNGIFEPLWNRNYIHHVEVTAAESIGVEDRGGYYDTSGALRDMVQNHLLQVVATVAMEPPSKFEANAVRNEKVKIFQSLSPIDPENVVKQVIRGQYLPAVIKGEKIAGYREEKGVPGNSKTETFVAMKFYIDSWRWAGVPFFVRTGKRLPTRVTEVVIDFKNTPHSLFRNEQTSSISDNQLVIRIQPDEGISLKFGMKRPGTGFNIKTVDMDFHYSDLGTDSLPEAYERLLLDCMLGDATLYARADAVEACWEFVTPILESWQENPEIKVHGYPVGTWGPEIANDLFVDPGECWYNPCGELV
ncbi:glucose-6-phosphate dehydrogenase [candidate division KSB1 bacterium]|nr:glucose-6-phosphate dehydrogenase [candidate division KSB1 bacterium]MBL7092368.1 glucose-6-phosphate dehydrogenase [candidate division KSB1 bacterium]